VPGGGFGQEPGTQHIRSTPAACRRKRSAALCFSPATQDHVLAARGSYGRRHRQDEEVQRRTHDKVWRLKSVFTEFQLLPHCSPCACGFFLITICKF
jgi:hypothetical protein